MLEKNEDIENMVVRPRNPRHRVIAQKSVFLQPSKGYIEVSDDNMVFIPACLKQRLLEYLRKFHDISTESIYNDLHGFIRYQNIHQNAYVQFYTGLRFKKVGMRQNHQKKTVEYKNAIEYYDKAINLNPDIGEAYHNRGWCWLHLQSGKKLRKILQLRRIWG